MQPRRPLEPRVVRHGTPAWCCSSGPSHAPEILACSEPATDCSEATETTSWPKIRGCQLGVSEKFRPHPAQLRHSSSGGCSCRTHSRCLALQALFTCCAAATGRCLTCCRLLGFHNLPARSALATPGGWHDCLTPQSLHLADQCLHLLLQPCQISDWRNCLRVGELLAVTLFHLDSGRRCFSWLS
jgi:hypothetical protein